MLLFDKALQFLTRREYSEKELGCKLKRFSLDSSEVDKTLHQLKALGYLDNQRFLESRIRHRLNQGYGSNRVVAELTQVHGFSREEIHPYLLPIEGTLKTLIQKKAKGLDLTDRQARQKLVQHCLQRGFLLGEILATLHDVSAQSDSAPLDSNV